MIAEPPPADPAPAARPAYLIVLAVVLALGLVASVSYTGWAAAQRLTATRVSAGEDQFPRYAEGALAAARACSESIFSYDYRSFDESVASGLECAAGAFRKEYRKTTRSLRATAVAEQSVVRAQVKEIGVMSATPRRVKVMAYINQYRRNANIDGGKLDQNRVILTLASTRGEWRVVGALAV